MCSIRPQTLKLGATIHRVGVNYCGEVGTSGTELLLGSTWYRPASVPRFLPRLPVWELRGALHSRMAWQNSGLQPLSFPFQIF